MYQRTCKGRLRSRRYGGEQISHLFFVFFFPLVRDSNPTTQVLRRIQKTINLQYVDTSEKPSSALFLPSPPSRSLSPCGLLLRLAATSGWGVEGLRNLSFLYFDRSCFLAQRSCFFCVLRVAMIFCSLPCKAQPFEIQGDPKKYFNDGYVFFRWSKKFPEKFRLRSSTTFPPLEVTISSNALM